MKTLQCKIFLGDLPNLKELADGSYKKHFLNKARKTEYKDQFTKETILESYSIEQFSEKLVNPKNI